VDRTGRLLWWWPEHHIPTPREGLYNQSLGPKWRRRISFQESKLCSRGGCWPSTLTLTPGGKNYSANEGRRSAPGRCKSRRGIARHVIRRRVRPGRESRVLRYFVTHVQASAEVLKRLRSADPRGRSGNKKCLLTYLRCGAIDQFSTTSVSQRGAARRTDLFLLACNARPFGRGVRWRLNEEITSRSRAASGRVLRTSVPPLLAVRAMGALFLAVAKVANTLLCDRSHRTNSAPSIY